MVLLIWNDPKFNLDIYDVPLGHQTCVTARRPFWHQCGCSFPRVWSGVKGHHLLLFVIVFNIFLHTKDGPSCALKLVWAHLRDHLKLYDLYVRCVRCLWECQSPVGRHATRRQNWRQLRHGEGGVRAGVDLLYCIETTSSSGPYPGRNVNRSSLDPLLGMMGKLDSDWHGYSYVQLRRRGGYAGWWWLWLMLRGPWVRAVSFIFYTCLADLTEGTLMAGVCHIYSATLYTCKWLKLTCNKGATCKKGTKTLNATPSLVRCFTW